MSGVQSKSITTTRSDSINYDYETRVTLFVTKFVSGFCSERLVNYVQERTLPGKMSAPGEAVGQVAGGGLGAGVAAGAGLPLVMGCTGGRLLLGVPSKKLSEYFSKKKHAKKSDAIIGNTPTMDGTNQDESWPLLIDTALTIVHCWNAQFKRICELEAWELRLRAIARDAVKRVFNYIAKNEETFSFSLKGLMDGVSGGKSGETTVSRTSRGLPKWVKVFDSMKAGEMLKISEDTEWNTREFFEEVGLITPIKLGLVRSGKEAEAQKYGYRKMYDDEDFDGVGEYKLVKPVPEQEEFLFGEEERDRIREKALEILKKSDLLLLAIDSNQSLHDLDALTQSIDQNVDKAIQAVLGLKAPIQRIGETVENVREVLHGLEPRIQRIDENAENVNRAVHCLEAPILRIDENVDRGNQAVLGIVGPIQRIDQNVEDVNEAVHVLGQPIQRIEHGVQALQLQPLNFETINEAGGPTESMRLHLEAGPTRKPEAVTQLLRMYHEVTRRHDSITIQEWREIVDSNLILVQCLANQRSTDIRQILIILLKISMLAFDTMMGRVGKTIWDTSAVMCLAVRNVIMCMGGLGFEPDGDDMRTCIMNMVRSLSPNFHAHAAPVFEDDRVQASSNVFLRSVIGVFVGLGCERALQLKYRETLLSELDGLERIRFTNCTESCREVFVSRVRRIKDRVAAEEI